MDYNEIIAGKIKQLRDERGISQKDFGEMVGYNQRTVSFWEKGSVKPDLNALHQISKKTGKPIAWFFDESADDRPVIQQTYDRQLQEKIMATLAIIEENIKEIKEEYLITPSSGESAINSLANSPSNILLSGNINSTKITDTMILSPKNIKIERTKKEMNQPEKPQTTQKEPENELGKIADILERQLDSLEKLNFLTQQGFLHLSTEMQEVKKNLRETEENLKGTEGILQLLAAYETGELLENDFKRKLKELGLLGLANHKNNYKSANRTGINSDIQKVVSVKLSSVE